jgi:UDP-N-acetylglucosamine 2-epimerase
MTARNLHILTPLSHQTVTSLVEQKVAAVDDLIADLSQFPVALYEVRPDQTSLNITTNLLPATDYWAVIRQWFTQFTQQTGLQEILAIHGYGLWWSLSYLKIAPGFSEFGNSLAWIDLLAALGRQTQPEMVIIYGHHHEAIAHIVRQIFTGVTIRVQTEVTSHTGWHILSHFRPGLMIVRILLSIIYLVYSLIWRPDICIFTSANAFRRKTVGKRQRFYDVYYGDLAQALQECSWRVAFVEQYGINASWERLWTRRMFFPSDLLLGISYSRLSWLVSSGRIARKWQRQWRKYQPSLMPHMQYQEYDITPLVLPLVREMFSMAVQVESAVNLWRWILRWWQPRLLYINASYSKYMMPVVIAAKSLDILTIEQQHGTISKVHMAYLIPKNLETKVQAPLCDFMVVWGDYVKRVLMNTGVYSSNQVVVCGFPRLDSWVKALPSRADITTLLNIPATASIVLYTSNAIVKDIYPEILDGFQEIFDSPMYWIIKLHPGEKTRQLWEQAIQERNLQHIIIIEDEVDFYALLAVSDLHVSFSSTTIIEAAVLGTPNLGLDLPNTPDPVGYAEAGAFLPVPPRQLGQTAWTILQDKAQIENLLQQQKAFAKDWCRHDGKAVECIVDFIEAKIRDKDAKVNLA